MKFDGAASARTTRSSAGAAATSEPDSTCAAPDSTCAAASAAGQRAPGGRFGPGTPGFTVTLALAMAMTALAIDSVLPAFGEIRSSFGLEATSTAVSALVTAFVGGLGLGQLPAGLLADRFGRRPVLWGGVAIYIAGAVLSMLAPTLPLMIVARFVWGLGAAGPRVAAVAMVRDAYSGERMARELSLIMAVFLLVPMVAPLVGTGLLLVGPWQSAFVLCIAVAFVLLALSSRLPPTLAPNERQPVTVAAVFNDWKTVLTAPGVLPYLIALTALTGSFMAYIASAEAIFKETYGFGGSFAVWFGGVALFLFLAVVANGAIVERVGLTRLMGSVSVVLIAVAAAMVVGSATAGGIPPFWMFYVNLGILTVCQQVLLTNMNAAAMVPLGAIAGTGSAVLGLIPLVAGSALATLISAEYDGTIGAFARWYLVTAVIGAAGIAFALRQAPLDSGRVSRTG